jgi:hypothetical protein
MNANILNTITLIVDAQVILNASEYFLLTPEDRAGVFNPQEPGPIMAVVASKEVSILSKVHFNFTAAPEVDHTYPFDDLAFPVRYFLFLCPFRGRQSQLS